MIRSRPSGTHQLVKATIYFYAIAGVKEGATALLKACAIPLKVLVVFAIMLVYVD